MKISFCVTTYNRVNELKQAVGSILNQKDLDRIEYELLISDDSTDDTTNNYVNSLLETNSAVRYLKNPYKGQFNNLNNVINNSKYDWIVFLHDDDLLSDNYLKEIVKVLSSYSTDEISIIWGARNLITKNGVSFNVLKSSLKSNKGFVEVENEKFFYQMLSSNDYTYQGLVIAPMVTGLMIRRELAKSVLFDNEFHFNADGLFLWKVYYLSKKSLFINKPIVNYRWVDNSERAKPSEKGVVFAEMKGILLKMIDFMEKKTEKRDLDMYRKKFMTNFYNHAVGLDSPVTWIALRYKGSYMGRLRIIFEILCESVKNQPELLIKPVFYMAVLLGILPRFVLEPMYRIYFKYIY
ncbi:MAG: glycosyltransferase [Candidatus Paceibacterota bacterium]